MSAPSAATASDGAPGHGAPDRILQRLEWHVIRRLDGLLQGDYRTLFLGHGLDFANLREYQPEDDVRSIDWNVTARMNAPYVRQYCEEREITAWFLLDLSPSMAFGPPERRKDAVLLDVTATLARLLTRNGNRVGALLYDQRVERTIAPGSGRRQVLRLIHEVVNRPIPAPTTMTDLTPLLTTALSTLRRRSLVCVVSDFVGADGWERPLSLLNRRHDLLAVRLHDPHEAALPAAGVILLEDAETGEQLYVDTSDPLFRRNFAALTAQRLDGLRAAFRRAGVDALDLSTEDDLVTALVRFADLRKRTRRVARR